MTPNKDVKFYVDLHISGFVTFCGESKPQPFRVFVAPDGDDSNEGTESAPVLTLGEAQIRVHAEKATNGMKDGIEVVLRDGNYQQTESLALSANDSGEVGNPDIWKSYPGETARITGSQTLDPADFTLMTAGDSEWSRLPAAAQGNVYKCDLGALGIADYGELRPRGGGSSPSITPMELFADNKPLQLARWPKPGTNENVQTGFTEDSIEIVGDCSPDVTGVFNWDGGPLVNGARAYQRAGLVGGVQYYLWRRFNKPDGIQYAWVISDEIKVNNNTPRWFAYRNLGTFDYHQYGATGHPSADMSSIWEGFAFTSAATGSIFKVLSPTADRLAAWESAPDPWFHGLFKYYWYDRLLDGVVDAVAGTITLSNNAYYGITPGKPFYAFNLLEELSTPGEYYLERSTGILYYWPDGDILSQDLQVSMLKTPVIEMTGADHINFEDLSVGMGRYHLIRQNSGDNVLFKNCDIYCPNIDAARIDGTNTGFSYCTIRDCGANGVRLNGGVRSSLTNGNDYIENCESYNTGRWSMCYSSPVRLTGCGNRAEHNHIHDLPHAAVLYTGNNHLIQYNDIHDVCTLTSDAGAIYAYRHWGYRGVDIIYNWIHDIASPFEPDQVHGVYQDGGVSAARTFGNYISDISGRGVFTSGGRDQIIENNIIWRCRQGFNGNDVTKTFYSDEPGSTNNLLERLSDDGVSYQTDPWLSAYPECAAIPNDNAIITNPDNDWLQPEDCILSRNMFWDCGIAIKAKHADVLDHYAEVEDNIEDANPLFVDEENGDLNLQTGSPANSIPGWKHIDFDSIGIKPFKGG